MDNRNMGIPRQLINSVFVRKFRWTLNSKQLDEKFLSEIYFQSVDISYAPSKLIHLRAVEFINKEQDAPIFEWLLNIKDDEELTLTTYDGCGCPIYEQIFTGMALVNMDNSFDYSISECSTIEAVLSFKDVNRRFVYKPELESTKTLGVTQNAEVEEIELCFLNSKMFIPGKIIENPIDSK